MILTVFHGSDVAVPQPLAKVGRKNVDFGLGFYVTKLRKQAEAWAVVIAGRKSRTATPIVSQYQFDTDTAKADGIRFKVFGGYDMEWLDYVVACRQGKPVWKQYDIVEGGVANDNVIDTVEDYEKGVITAEQALGQLRYKKVNHQICFVSQKAIDSYLKFEKTITIKTKKEQP
jgi:hypothetical protein